MLLDLSIGLNIVLLSYIAVQYYPYFKNWLKPTILPVRVETHYQVLEPTKPLCPTCSQEILGKLMKSVSGHWCCQTCYSTKFGNR